MKLGDEVRSKGKGGQADRTFLSCGAEEGERGGRWEGMGGGSLGSVCSVTQAYT